MQREISELDKFILKLKLWDKPITFVQIREFYFKSGVDTIFNEYDYIKNVKGLKVNTIKAYKIFKKHQNKHNPKVKFNELTE